MFSVSLFINSTFKVKYLQIDAILVLYWIIDSKVKGLLGPTS